MGIKVYFPRINGGMMDAVKIDDQTQYFKNEYGIVEPMGQSTNDEIEAIIIPLLAYDLSFNRLGRGKGYYDGFLKNRNGARIAVAFGCQCAESIPTENFDQKMDVIVTENELLVRRKV